MRSLQSTDPFPLVFGPSNRQLAAMREAEARFTERSSAPLPAHIAAFNGKPVEPVAEAPKQAAPKFKFGDRVVATKAHLGGVVKRNAIGTVVSASAWAVVVSLDGHDGTSYCLRSDLMHASSYIKLDPPAPIDPKPIADGWIAHDTTKPCPLAEGTRIEVRLRNGEVGRGETRVFAERAWIDDGSDIDRFTIVAYRILA